MKRFDDISPTVFKMKHNMIYAEIMTKLWTFPQNDQRPQVLSWVNAHNIQGNSVLDVGAGDAYYLENIRPLRYDYIEPNIILRQHITVKLLNLKIPCTCIDNIHEITEYNIEKYDLILLLHVIFYLEFEELAHLLNVIKYKRILIVHPFVDNSVSCQFEKYLGIETSREKVRYKEEVLGKPNEIHFCKSHFNLPITIKKEEIAFLICHHLLYHRDSDSSKILNAANKYVEMHHVNWKKSDFYQIPQCQVIEIYNQASRL